MFRRLLFIALLLVSGLARALTGAEATAIATGDNDARIAALNATAAKGDARLAALVQALLADEVKVAAGWVGALIREKTASTWPAAIVALAGAWAGDDSLEARREGPVADLPREPF